MDPIVNLFNKTALFPSDPSFTFDLRKCFEPSDVHDALKTGLGNKVLVGGEFDFGTPSLKNYFFHKIRETKGTVYFIFVDFQDSEKTVPKPTDAITPSIGLDQYLPPSMLEMVDPWYSREYEKLFEPRDGETAREAALTQMTLLREAANDEKTMKKLIDGFEDHRLGCSTMTLKKVFLGKTGPSGHVSLSR